FIFFFSSRRRHTRSTRDWSSDVCSSDLSSLCCSLRDSFCVDLHAKTVEFFAQQSNRAEHADLDKRNGYASGLGDVVVRLFFNQGQRCHEAVFCRELLESCSDALAGLPADCGISACCAREIFGQGGFATRMPEVVESGGSSDAT